jgi:hypothetical protein
MSAITLPKTLSNGTTANADDVMANFNALVTGIDNLTNMTLTNSGNNIPLTINNTGTESGIYINQSTLSAANKHALFAYSNVAQTSSALALLQQNNASSTKPALHVDWNGTVDDASGATGLEIDGCEVANGTAGITISNVGPSAIGTATITKWLAVNISGTIFYMPLWT